MAVELNMSKPSFQMSPLFQIQDYRRGKHNRWQENSTKSSLLMEINRKQALSIPTGGDIRFPENGMKFLFMTRKQKYRNMGPTPQFTRISDGELNNRQTKLSKSKSKCIKYSATKYNFVKLNRQILRTKEGGAITINTLILSLLNLFCSINSILGTTNKI